MTAIRLDNISKVYDNGVSAVSGVSLDIAAGEFLVLVGPSGCGKSTLLRMIAGLEVISSGELRFDSSLMNDTAPRDRDIGMVFQNYALYPHLSVYENIAFPLRVRKMQKEQLDARVNEVARMLSIDHLLQRLPKHLSGGQRQRVAVGRAVARNPRVFLFDEPLSNLDANLRVEMRAELTALQKRFGTTSVYVTHDHVEAMTMGDRIAVLRDGRVMQVGTPQELYSNPQNDFVASFLGTPSINFFEGHIVQDDGLRFIDGITGLTVALTGSAFTRSTPSTHAVARLAVRAENVVVSDEQPDFQSTVELVEYIGHESIVHFRRQNLLLSARSQAYSLPQRNEKIGLKIDRNGILLFDQHGQRL